jgi:hypothetical protein
MTPPPDPARLIEMARRVMRDPPIKGVDVTPHESVDLDAAQGEDADLRERHERKAEGK